MSAAARPEAGRRRHAAPEPAARRALSRAYVRAVAARAGLICGGTENDLGFDLFLRSVEIHGQQLWDGGPQLDVQLKSTTRAEVRETVVAYDLEVRAYNILRQENASRPRILVVLVLPEDESEWVSQTEDLLIVRRSRLLGVPSRGQPADRSDERSHPDPAGQCVLGPVPPDADGPGERG